MIGMICASFALITFCAAGFMIVKMLENNDKSLS